MQGLDSERKRRIAERCRSSRGTVESAPQQPKPEPRRSIKDVLEELRQENADLRGQYGKLREENAELRKECEAQEALIEDLKDVARAALEDAYGPGWAERMREEQEEDG